MQNRLPFVFLAGVTLYFVIGSIAPSPFISTVASVMVLIFGGLTTWRYTSAAVDILVYGERPKPDQAYGSHYAVLGIWFLSIGSFYVGTFGALWVAFDQPAAWLGTPISGAGHATMAAGFWLLLLSPDVHNAEIPFRGLAWLVIACTAAVLIAFFLGRETMRSELLGAHDYRRVMSPICPTDYPVIGSPNGVFHGPSSAYRPMTVPRACFLTHADALRAGYRAPITSRLAGALQPPR